ncbi:MAG: CDP-diacylglycerol--glycerol-3-phosphate 3-phosphatidyltransferase [Elusimicrobia bacterium GWA2_69_24]|nr:MAG: CDP-diacylglycerol--glycerol-3-phosphate 3-phosphatidyltransferase [Elusimicrobia bacterium GWA2_69_24]HBL18804.1 CDP-diacylglycerol--glycerol-3-phosphate 3-phosphatidyltransferase [Elusimicrobiota bacterium]
MTFANKLTLGRVVLALLTFGCLWVRSPALYAAALVFYALAAITDWVDGWIARRTHSVSPFGVLADPIADKILIIGALIAFVRDPLVDVPSWAVFIIIVRELLIGGIRALAALQGVVIAADRGGKWKMAVQSVSVLFIILLLVWRTQGGAEAAPWLDRLPYPLTVLSMVVSLLSGGQYAYNARHMIRKSWNAPPQP